MAGPYFHTYIEFKFRIAPENPGKEILIAELSEQGFESFVEAPHTVWAYIKKDELTAHTLENIHILHSADFDISYGQQEIEEQDWNALWESNFQPIIVSENCIIHASFHPKSNTKYDIIINPKMAFGTGHHATTFMMAQYLLEENLTSKKILDMGSGTGVLSILAEKRGARQVEAIDIDPWCYENTQENSRANHCRHIRVRLGDRHLLQGEEFDFILANINRNILLKDLQTYASSLVKDGTLLVSGFYEQDLESIRNKSEQNGMSYVSHKEKEGWLAVKFTKATAKANSL